MKIIYNFFGGKQDLTMTFEASDGNEELWCGAIKSNDISVIA